MSAKQGLKIWKRWAIFSPSGDLWFVEGLNSSKRSVWLRAAEGHLEAVDLMKGEGYSIGRVIIARGKHGKSKKKRVGVDKRLLRKK